MISTMHYPQKRVARVSRKILGPTISHYCVWSRHVPQLSLPVAFSTGVVAVPGSAIITPTILDNTTTKGSGSSPYNPTLRRCPATKQQPLYLRKSASSTPCDARNTLLRSVPHINTTPGSPPTPTALPIVLDSRLRATACKGSLDLIFDDHHFCAGKGHRKPPLDMLNGQ